MTIFLTSSPTLGWAGPLNPANGFVDELRESLARPIRCAMVSSYPDDTEITDRMAWELRECFEWARMKFDHFEVIDRRTEPHAARIIRGASFVILCGGHVPTENAFFSEIRLKDLLKGFEGTIMGISAGSMNCAADVYAPPELAGEATDPGYRRYFRGLGLTGISMLPHFQDLKNARIDGLRLVRDIMAPESMRRAIFCLHDGAYFKIANGYTILCGAADMLKGGRLRRVCRDGERKLLGPDDRLFKL